MEIYEVIIKEFMEETGFEREDAIEMLQEGKISFLELIEEIEGGDETATDEILKKLHKLKGASANLRMKAMAGKIAEMERFVADKKIDEFKKELKELKKFLQTLGN